MLDQLLSHLPDSTSYQSLFVAGYIDPGLGYSFQSLGPILPAIAGAITGGIALFWGHIKLFLSKLFGKKDPSCPPEQS